MNDSHRVKELALCIGVREIRQVMLRVASRPDVNFDYFSNTYTKVDVESQFSIEIVEDLSMFKKPCVFHLTCALDAILVTNDGYFRLSKL